MNSKLNFILVGLLFFISLVVFESHSDAQVLPSRTIDVQGAEILPRPCSILNMVNEKEGELASASLDVGDKDIVYYENRIANNGGKISVTKKRIQEPQKEIALKLLNTATCEISIIKITKNGADLVSPPGFDIRPVERVNGIRWNKWNTEFKIYSPANLVVIKNKYPEVVVKTTKVPGKDKQGRKITITKKQKVQEEFMYVPYSEALHVKEFVDKGRRDLKTIVQTAYDELRASGVRSKIFPDKNVADVEALSPKFIQRLPLLEQTDTTEFIFNSVRAFERVEVILAANGSLAYSKTCSKKSACGLFQFTDVFHGKKPGTYTSIARAYLDARLISGFESGAKDLVNSAKAAILLYDYNITNLVKKYGSEVLSDPLLEEYAGAAYNGSPKWVNKSLSASISNALDDWTGNLKSETKGYMLKLRYLKENNLP